LATTFRFLHIEQKWEGQINPAKIKYDTNRYLKKKNQ